MKISEREPGDVTELIRRARDERRALQRDRYRAVLLALQGRRRWRSPRALVGRVAACRIRSTPIATAGSTR
jgi:hypothetical protein